MQSKFTIGVFGLLFDREDKVLLCHRRDYDLWNLPGGGLEKGESVSEGLKRELWEETGLTVKISKLIGIYNKPEKNEVIFCFTCEKIDGEITLNEEADQIEYFSIDKLPKNFPKKQKERIEDAMKNSKYPVFKTQSGKSSIEVLRENLL